MGIQDAERGREYAAFQSMGLDAVYMGANMCLLGEEQVFVGSDCSMLGC